MKSEFIGSTFEYIKMKVIYTVLKFITLGIATPWILCRMEKWYCEHTIIDGQPLEFDGKPSQLLQEYLLRLLLSYLSFGIYSFWLSLRMKRWVISHTHIKGEIRQLHA